MMLLIGWYCVMGRQFELMDESGKINKAHVHHIKITYPVNELIKC